MTTATLTARLAAHFGEAAMEHFIPRHLAPKRRDQMVRHLRWLRSDGRFGRRLVIDCEKDAFNRASLDAEDFSKSKLSRVTFNWSNLRLVNFVGAELRHVLFHACDLEKVNFKGAVFENVKFENCPDIETACFEDVTFVPWSEGRQLTGAEKQQYAKAARLAY